MTKEEAIDIIENRFDIMDYCESARLSDALDVAVDALKNSDETKHVTTPQPKMGQWIRVDTGHSVYYKCSECDCLAPCTETNDSFIWKLSTYCPDCGIKMQEVKENGLSNQD